MKIIKNKTIMNRLITTDLRLFSGKQFEINLFYSNLIWTKDLLYIIDNIISNKN